MPVLLCQHWVILLRHTGTAALARTVMPELLQYKDDTSKLGGGCSTQVSCNTYYWLRAQIMPSVGLILIQGTQCRGLKLIEAQNY